MKNVNFTFNFSIVSREKCTKILVENNTNQIIIINNKNSRDNFQNVKYIYYKFEHSTNIIEGPFTPCLNVQMILMSRYLISGVYVSDFNDFKSL